MGGLPVRDLGSQGGNRIGRVTAGTCGDTEGIPENGTPHPCLGQRD